jgi:hypothetical protein
MEKNADGNNMMKEFYIPTYIFVPESPVEHVSQIPTCPVIVFINTKSGGLLGCNLIVTYRKLLNHAQVFDLLDEAPDKVLHKLYSNLERLKHGGDTLASEIYRRLRLIVAGGDGTAGWLLGIVSDLKLAHPPPVATVPLGTGNNLPYSFGWGKRNPGTDQDSVISFLQLVRESREMNIDRWVCFLKPLLPFSMKSLYGIWMLTNTGNHTIIQLAYCHEHGKPKRFTLRSNCTSRLASFVACISPRAKDRSTRYGIFLHISWGVLELLQYGNGCPSILCVSF